MIDTTLGWLFRLMGIMQSVKVRCHVASFVNSETMRVFVNVVNLSLSRDIEITHVWFDCNGEIPLINNERKLPRRLKPEESWETWIRIQELGALCGPDVLSSARVRLSNGKIIKSKRNKSVPSRGEVPGQ